MIPSQRLLWAVLVVAAIAIAVSIFPEFQLPWTAVAAGFLLLALLDAFAGLRLPAPALARHVPGSLALGVRTEVRLRVANAAGMRMRLELHDHHPASFEAEGLPRRLELERAQWTEVAYQVRPVARGEAEFGAAEVRLYSPLGLWFIKRFAGNPTPVRVYPNFRALAKYTLLATDNRLSQIGVLQVRRRGEGTEFHQLREYRQGDAQRAIDWKATSRTGRLISREYEEEKDQRVMLVIDCGRRMASKDDELSHFDHALNAALLLAHVALRQGDAVGMMTMAGVNRYCEPRKSVGAVNDILNRVYDIEPTLAVPDYNLAASDVMRHLRRRSLVIVLTNLRDEDDETLLPALKLLRTRHLVVLASLREAIISRALWARVDSFDRAVTHAAAADYLAARERTFRRIGASGAVCLDVEPERLAISLVNRYLELKREGRL
ncbi:MAG TPA: DUF58 domain-containing protein [Burkholderiales bacterium]|nr:DUF58 domain-containing protein [Burkholderiales bacterium]